MSERSERINGHALSERSEDNAHRNAAEGGRDMSERSERIMDTLSRSEATRMLIATPPKAVVR